MPKGTYVIDLSVNELMTRWFVIHSTLDVTLARNVGYKSIGHGFYLEDSTETDNRLYANLRCQHRDRREESGPRITVIGRSS